MDLEPDDVDSATLGAHLGAVLDSIAAGELECTAAARHRLEGARAAVLDSKLYGRKWGRARGRYTPS